MTDESADKLIYTEVVLRSRTGTSLVKSSAPLDAKKLFFYQAEASDVEEACKKLTDAGFTVIAHSQFGISIVGTGELYKKYFNTDVVQPIRLNRQAAEVLRLADGITPQIAHDLMNLDAQVQVSLDGSKPEIYDILRPGQKAFTK